MLEVWLASVHVPGTAIACGQTAEAEGFDGISFGDTQNLAADPFGGLCLVAAHTDRLRLMVGVTNPVTRHPAVTAAAIATVQVESAGRAVLGVGRGDSSLGHLGRRPAPVEVTERFATQLQCYLRSEVVDMDGHRSEIPWIARAGQPKVPLDVAATGPRMLALGGRLAERVTVNVGALPDRIDWAVEVTRAARAEAEPTIGPVSLGAYLVVTAHPDARVARRLARGPLAAYTHFSGMAGAPVARLHAQDRAVVKAVAADYIHTGHSTQHPPESARQGPGQGQALPRHLQHLDDAFVDRFGVVGTPAHCVSRLLELADLGLDRVLLVEGRDPAAPGEQRRAHHCLAEEVLPALHADAA
jgi:5,10-methylenetetrahydromethanopterin reductase